MLSLTFALPLGAGSLFRAPHYSRILLAIILHACGTRLLGIGAHDEILATMQSRGRFQPVVDGGTLALIKVCVGSTETTRSSVDVEARRKFWGVPKLLY